MSSHQAPLSIKIKHATVIHKLQVNQHVPIWSTFSAAIAQRFGMPEEQPIGLQYLDPEGDTITISTQADCDELWHKVLSVTAISSQTGGVDQRNRCLELALINHHLSGAQPPRTNKLPQRSCPSPRLTNKYF
ncbi:hypothetical protein MJO29_003449 [Puccinia striiformis f. sp. tritici]|uniref:hypothetical protein n=1 Tax=Puccinia striiformis f. sp. tritici TaxID=168172 RepID=UPI0020073E6F|nr:hypothetical protein Pst134EA_004692 [Puccinia striiformis f. sp. tritici]KAH9461838.1 hypothetical protein Pst134EB_005759 [Puccinia striiformis f. sp. tritici]KAH9470766.1 hypothetical protein Pst134EA_004692 [Puccinia striiformis f. sp. tritici]KAI7965351.1 hypothetical protein MJO29_003449 [Puccinia striiformis f. sp. tritici]KAI9623058.1 hypothetical protein KEM48_009677 [Puccinia striiformis f. sp. tritici PST-130]